MSIRTSIFVLLGGLPAVAGLFSGALLLRWLRASPPANSVTVTILSPDDGSAFTGGTAEFRARIDAQEETTVEYLLDGQSVHPSAWAVPPSQ